MPSDLDPDATAFDDPPLGVVKFAPARFPNLEDAIGPHGITLKRHAEKGGEGAKKVLEYLETLESTPR